MTGVVKNMAKMKSETCNVTPNDTLSRPHWTSYLTRMHSKIISMYWKLGQGADGFVNAEIRVDSGPQPDTIEYVKIPSFFVLFDVHNLKATTLITCSSNPYANSWRWRRAKASKAEGTVRDTRVSFVFHANARLFPPKMIETGSNSVICVIQRTRMYCSVLILVNIKSNHMDVYISTHYYMHEYNDINDSDLQYKNE